MICKCTMCGHTEKIEYKDPLKVLVEWSDRHLYENPDIEHSRLYGELLTASLYVEVIEE